MQHGQLTLASYLGPFRSRDSRSKTLCIVFVAYKCSVDTHSHTVLPVRLINDSMRASTVTTAYILLASTLLTCTRVQGATTAARKIGWWWQSPATAAGLFWRARSLSRCLRATVLS